MQPDPEFSSLLLNLYDYLEETPAPLNSSNISAQYAEQSISSPVEKCFPPKIINAAMTLTLDQFYASWGDQIDDAQYSTIRAAMQKAVASQIDSAFDSEGEVFSESKSPAYKHWYSKLPGEFATEAWKEIIGDNEEGKNTIATKAEEIYRDVVMNDNNQNADIQYIVSKVQKGAQSDIASSTDSKTLMHIELMVRLANITWFSTQFLRASLENKPERLTDVDMGDFRSMVSQNQRAYEEGSQKHNAEFTIAKDLWQILSNLYSSEELAEKGLAERW